MKNTKNIFVSMVVIAAALGSSQIIQSAEFFNEPAVAIYNKSKEDITVNIMNLENNVAYIMGIPGEKEGRYDADINSRLRFEIWSQSDSNKEKTLGVFSIDAPGKTKYISWDPAKSPALYPQTGPLMGFGKLVGMKSKFGLSLKNNVTPSQIKTEKAQYSVGQAPTRKVQKPAQ